MRRCHEKVILGDVSARRRSEIRLMDKMKLNCQVFKAEISVVHLNRQVAHLKNALQDRSEKVIMISGGSTTHAAGWKRLTSRERGRNCVSSSPGIAGSPLMYSYIYIK